MTRCYLIAIVTAVLLGVAACTSAPGVRCVDLGGAPVLVLATCAPEGERPSDTDLLTWRDEGGTGWTVVCGDDMPEVDCSGPSPVVRRIPRTPMCSAEVSPPTCIDGSAPRCVPVVCP